MSAPTFKRRAFAVWFKDLKRWNVSYFRAPRWRWPDEIICPLGSVARLESQPIATRKAQEKSMPLIAKINFSGELFLRSEPDYERYKGRLFVVSPNRMIFSKINARQGCIAWVPSTHPAFAVSSEYPVFELDELKIVSRFLDLVLRTKPARAQLNGAAAGMAKPRTSVEEFLALEVPLPPLETQRAIVAVWEDAGAAGRDALAKIKEREAKIDADFLAALGLKAPRRAKPRKCFAVWWKDMERWSVNFIARNQSLASLNEGLFPIFQMGNLAQISYGIQKSPANRPGVHARPYLRVANVQNGRLDLRVVKEINVSDNEFASLRLQRDDLLVCEGNSAELVGRPAIWRGEIPDCVHQNHILKVRLDRLQAEPEFVLMWMQTSFARAYFRSRAKFTTNLASINSTDLREVPIPLPPLETQREIMAQMTQSRAEVATWRAALDKETARAGAELEAALVGRSSIAL